MSRKLDILYPLGRGSIFNDDELRFSLRSLQHYCSNYGKIYITGHHLPKWIRNVNHIHSNYIIYNYHCKIAYAIYEACKYLSNEFILMNDDFFFNKKIDLLNFENKKRNYNLKQHLKIKRNTFYALQIKETSKYFTDHYDLHYPMVINRDNFIKVFQKWEAKIMNTPCLLYRSVYGNEYINTNKVTHDLKISSPIMTLDLIKDRDVYSVGDGGFTGILLENLKKLPKSNYEN